MPLQKSRWNGSEWAVFQGPRTPDPPSLFLPGQTMPVYEPTLDFSGGGNVGLPPNTELDLYSGRVIGGITQLPSGTYDELDFSNTLLDIRGNVTFNACRGILDASQGGLTGAPQQISVLNGSGTNTVVINDSEFHNRGQHIIDGINGRNYVVNRSVFTGHVDAARNNMANGSAPFNTPGELNDSWLGDSAWWRHSSNGVVHGSDTQTHNDGFQSAAGGVKFSNVFFYWWPSEWVGTGTLGSSTAEGNPYSLAYTTHSPTTQALWRSLYLNRWSVASQSFQGVSRRTSTGGSTYPGGSWAAIMGTLAGGGALNFEIDHCWFSGATVPINMSNLNLTGYAGSIRRSVFWNDMAEPIARNPATTKGTAVYLKSDLEIDMPTSGADRNLWFDGTTVYPTAA